MIEYVNLFLLLTIFGSTCYAYYRLKKIFYFISIAMDSEILDQLTNLGRDVDSEFPKPKRGHKKKADTKINELEDNDVRDKRERLVACVLSGNSKMYLRKEYTEEQINKMDCNDVNTLLNRYESVLNSQMNKSLGKSIINLYSNLACSVLGVDNQQELSTDLECDPFLNIAMQRFTCDLYYRFGALLAPVSVGIITGKHYTKQSTVFIAFRINGIASGNNPLLNGIIGNSIKYIAFYKTHSSLGSLISKAYDGSYMMVANDNSSFIGLDYKFPSSKSDCYMANSKDLSNCWSNGKKIMTFNTGNTKGTDHCIIGNIGIK